MPPPGLHGSSFIWSLGKPLVQPRRPHGPSKRGKEGFWEGLAQFPNVTSFPGLRGGVGAPLSAGSLSSCSLSFLTCEMGLRLLPQAGWKQGRPA